MQCKTFVLPAVSVALVCAVSGGAHAYESNKPTAGNQDALEKQLARTLSGATLVGSFTIDGQGSGGKPGTDRYEIDRAEKVEGNRWIISARIKYGKNDVKMPVPLDIFWAGDTPVMTLTKVTIPGLGTFTSRIMIYGDRYAGTWQHDSVGGHMWGRIERTKAAPAASPADTPAK